MTITALLDLTLTPEGVAEAPRVLRETLVATRAFDGCRGVEVLIDADDETHILLVETWDSIESDDAYRAWRLTPAGQSELRTLLASPPRLTRFTSASDV